MPTRVSPAGTDTHHRRAAHAYKTSSNHSLSERETMAEAMRVVINNLHLARDAHANRTLDVMVDFNLKNIKILDVLAEELAGSDALKDPEASAAAKFLLNTYRETIIRIADVLHTPSPQDEFNALIETLTPIYRAWLPPAPTTAPDQENSQS